MRKEKLFHDDSDEEISLKTENEYAKKYDAWRQKEELHKLEQKYGEGGLNEGSGSDDSEDESDEPPEETEEMEAQFLKTLSLLKTKDPRIYDPNFKFFKDKDTETENNEPATTSTLTFEDSEDEDEGGEIFKIEKKASEGSDGAGRSGTTHKAKGKLKEFLTGRAEHIDDPVERDLAPLKALWSDPKLNEGEAFLRDYILNKRYLDGGGAEGAGGLRDDEELEADRETVEHQGRFERAYNFRFEEPDDEFLKRFPRTMNYIRPKDERRARRRADTRVRKDAERARRMDDIARLKALKLKEIQEKIAKIKEVTGNDDLAFQEEDIEGEFDPTEHDRRMRAIFDDQYYGQPEPHKPDFPELDHQLEIENWETFEGEEPPEEAEDDSAHCEDEDFNMDAEHEPRKTLAQEVRSALGPRRRSRRNKSLLARLLARRPPTYTPSAADDSYRRFMDQYYSMDCEDIVAGQPTRFKYRQVVPNDYGLTVEEILMADDRELTAWVPLKKIVKHRAAEAERGDVRTYAARAADSRLKRRLLPSLFRHLPQEPELVVPQGDELAKKKKKKNKNKDKESIVDENEEEKNASDEPESTNDGKKTADKNNDSAGNIVDDYEAVDDQLESSRDCNKKKRKEKKKKNSDKQTRDDNEGTETGDRGEPEPLNGNKHKDKSKKNKNCDEQSTHVNGDDEVLHQTESGRGNENKHKHKSKKKKRESEETKQTEAIHNIQEISGKRKKHKKVENTSKFTVEEAAHEGPSQHGSNEHPSKRKMSTDGNAVAFKKKKNSKNNKKKEKFNKKETSDNPLSRLSDERLKAYGLNPKKYRSFLKYKKF